MRTQLSLFSLTLAFALGVTGAEADIYQRGKGPVTISSGIVTGFEKYKLEDEPTYFAISNDGRNFGYTQCPHFNCLDNNGDQARELCDRRAKSRGSECSIFAIGREIVWEGEITYPVVNADFLFLFAKTVGDYSTNYSGTGNLFDNGRMIDLRVGRCRGEANLATKKWVLRGCKNNYSASGTFVAGTGTEKYYGIGRSSTGGSAEIKLLVPASSGGKISKSKGQHPTIPASVSDSAIAKYKAIVGKISYMGKPTHKAFTASDGGAYGYTYNQRGIFAAVARAFSHCMKRNNSSSSCRLYDLDGFALEGMEAKEATAWAQKQAPAWLAEKEDEASIVRGHPTLKGFGRTDCTLEELLKSECE